MCRYMWNCGLQGTVPATYTNKAGFVKLEEIQLFGNKLTGATLPPLPPRSRLDTRTALCAPTEEPSPSPSISCGAWPLVAALHPCAAVDTCPASWHECSRQDSACFACRQDP